ncbi:hypothetical protein [Achromobacter anxifer]|uniref:hypothetical protein n=1 Tax=Achromobacter anxifer TaxID=1287737 RepID=UPI0023F778E0|nr:hypothetical protein [Achromobacter anxifer]MDF8365311.1 hypothetical protein [Achromobacter anxifer]
MPEAINFCNRLWNLEDDTEYEFDFSRLGTVEPFPMAYVANELKRFRQSKAEAKFSALNYKDHTYAAHMGFFRAFGLQFGKAPGEAAGSSTYIPLTRLDVKAVVGEAIDRGSHHGDVIEDKAQQIAQLLVREKNGPAVDTLTYSIREIMRNVVEHSESPHIDYCGQYWPSRKLIEVAILDSGCGVRRGLESNPFIKMDSDRDALHLALMPGISGKMYKGVRKRTNDVWQNSGFGLYMTSRICRSANSFVIISNGAGLFLSEGQKKDRVTTFKGTALRLRITADALQDSTEMLAQYAKEGHAAAKRISGGEALEPSAASSMLSRNFRHAD